MRRENREIEKREEREGRESERLKLSIMSTCGYAHEVLSGFLSSNRVISLILLKLEYLSVLSHNLYLGYFKKNQSTESTDGDGCI